MTNVVREIVRTSPELEYKSRKYERKNTIKWGQRKLLLSEIQFLTHFWDAKVVPKPIVVYAGAAPGTHLPILAILFPQVTFHLYDPRPFQIRGSGQIVIHQQLFGSQDEFQWARIQKEQSNVFFISDIRTGDLQVDTDPQIYEAKIWQDMLLQQKWVQSIQPIEALLKFRLPYGKGRRNPSAAVVSYLDGRVFTQPFAGSTSTETRLLPLRDEHGGFATRQWDIFKYENQLYYHNTVDREIKVFPNPLNGKEGPISPPELMNDHDSVCECLCLMEYINRASGRSSADSDPSRLLYNVPMLSKLITANLSRVKRLTELREIKYGLATNEARVYCKP